MASFCHGDPIIGPTHHHTDSDGDNVYQHMIDAQVAGGFNLPKMLGNTASYLAVSFLLSFFYLDIDTVSPKEAKPHRFLLIYIIHTIALPKTVQPPYHSQNQYQHS